MACTSAMAAACAVTPASNRGTTSCSSCRGTSSCSFAPLPARRATSFRGAALPRLTAQSPESLRVKRFSVRAASTEESAGPDVSKQAEDFFADAKSKWDQVENKTTVALYAGGALVALWLSSTIVGAINSVPVLPKAMELVGLGYTGWFVYRYLLFKTSRKELVADIEELKGKITGATDDEPV